MPPQGIRAGDNGCLSYLLSERPRHFAQQITEMCGVLYWSRNTYVPDVPDVDVQQVFHTWHQVFIVVIIFMAIQIDDIHG